MKRAVGTRDKEGIPACGIALTAQDAPEKTEGSQRERQREGRVGKKKH
jgi:hypothetical protein